MKRILAIASGKGGVGKTWTSISLSHALARLNRRVLLVDCDVGLANVDVQLGLRPSVDLQHAYLGNVAFSQVIKRLDSLGFDVVSGRAEANYLHGLDASIVAWMLGELDHIASAYDFVILDLPTGLELGIRELMLHADYPIIVTTGEPTAMTDAYALIKAMRRTNKLRVPGLICNFAEHEQAGLETLAGLVRVCERFLDVKPNQLGVIRRDRRVPEAISRQTALLECYPRSDAARDISAMAKTFLTWKAGR
ncbi:MAG: AAA family ATPase [Pseudomonadota bacterium]